MSLINNIKQQVDLPVWEWLRLAPVTGTSATCMTTSDGTQDEYLYVLFTATNFWRYNTITDAWQQLATPPVAPVTPCALKFSTYNGYRGRVISNTDSTKFVAAGLDRGVLNGYKIRIIAGTGIGQERTISSVSEPTIHDYGINTAATPTTAITDSTKAWTINQYSNYQVRVVLGTGASVIRKILYNNATVLTYADTNWGNYESRYYGITPALGAASSVYQIESSTFTVSQAWTTNPDNTSKFVLLSGGVWLCAANAATPYMSLQFYDIAADVWYQKTCTTQIPGVLATAAAMSTDVTLEKTGEVFGAYLTGTAHASTASTAKTLTTSVANLTPNRWNNFMIKITGGTGIGQTRAIVYNTDAAFTINRAWDVIPETGANTTYSIFGDTDKLYLMGGGWSAVALYSAENDIWALGPHFDSGVCAIGYVKLVNPSGVLCEHKPFAVSGIVGNGSTPTVTTVLNHNFKVGDHINIGGAITNTGLNQLNAVVAAVPSTTTFTYTNATNATATFTALSATVIVDSSKGWTADEHTGRYVCLMTGTGPVATTQIRRIVSNTPTTLTVGAAPAMTAGINGTSRYVIFDNNILGIFDPSDDGVNYTEKTGGSTTALTAQLNGVDKVWVASALVGRKIKVLTGAAAGQERAITANNASTITCTAFANALAAGDIYKLVVDFVGTTTSTTVMTVASGTWPTNSLTGKRVKFISGAAAGQEQTIASNTGSTITTGTFTAPAAGDNFVIIKAPPRGFGIQAVWNAGVSITSEEGKYIYCFRGGSAASTGQIFVDRLNLTTGTWDFMNTFPQTEVFSSGTNYAYDGIDSLYIQKDNTLRFYKLNLITHELTPSSQIAFTTGTAVVGNRMEIITTVDGLKYLYFLKPSATEFFRTLIFW